LPGSPLMRFAICALLVIGAAAPAVAQSRDSASGPGLTLDDAIQLARRNNPTHLQTTTARSRAGAAVRSAYGALIPTFGSNFGSSYREGRQQFFAGQAFGSSSDVISSSAGLNIDAQYSASSFLTTRYSKAQLDAAESDVTSS